MLSKRRLGPWFLFGLLVLLGLISLRIVGVFADWVLVGLLLGYVTYPVFRRLERWIPNRKFAAGLMLLLVLVCLVVPAVFLALELVGEVRAINQGLAGQDPQVFVDAMSAEIGDLFGPGSQNSTTEAIQAGYDGVRSFLREQTRALPTTVLSATVGFFVLFYLLYYVYLDGPTLVAFTRDILPMDEGHRDLLMHEVALVVRAVMYGSVLTALLQAVLGVIGFTLFGVPNVLFWGVLMFILALLPIVGPPIIWAPWGIYLLSQGEMFRGIGLLVYSAILVSTVDNVVRPQLIGSVAKIHPAIILLGVLGGVVVFGFIGFIVGPLVLSIFVSILRVYRKEFMSRLDEHESREMWLR